MAHETTYAATSRWWFPTVHVRHWHCVLMQMCRCCTPVSSVTHQNLKGYAHKYTPLISLFPSTPWPLFPLLNMCRWDAADRGRLCVHLVSTAWTRDKRGQGERYGGKVKTRGGKGKIIEEGELNKGTYQNVRKTLKSLRFVFCVY